MTSARERAWHLLPNPPDFGLLFLAHFMHFSICTETQVIVHTTTYIAAHLQALVSVLKIESSKLRRYQVLIFDHPMAKMCCMQSSVFTFAKSSSVNVFAVCRVTDFVEWFSVWSPRGFQKNLHMSRKNMKGETAWTFGTECTSLNWSYYRKRGSASYIVREVLSVRERERERYRERERERETEVTSPFWR